MARINFTVEDHSIRVDNLVELAQGSNNFDVCNFEFDSSWDGYTKYGIFYQNPSEAIKVPLSDNSCNIPAEVLKTAGKLYVGARGVLDGTHVATTQMVSFRIRNGAVDGSTGATEEITASEYEIVMAAVTKVNARIDNLIANNNNTEGNSELVDIRVDANGNVHGSAGEAVRAQVRELKSSLDDLKQNGTSTGSGVTTAMSESLYAIIQKTAFAEVLTDEELSAFKMAWGLTGGSGDSGDEGETEKILSSISATYTGGEVATGTSLSSLTGITVTATYSDGTSKTVTGYTLSGEILEGENTVTVSYGGLTTTFTVTGVAGSGGETTAELITDGLVAFFDMRTATYNNAGSGGTTTISPTQGSGWGFAWANNCVTAQDEYGISTSRAYNFSKNGDTTATYFGKKLTVVSLTYGHVPYQGFNYSNVGSNWTFKPQYNTESGTAYATEQNGNLFNNDNRGDYNFCCYRIDGTTLTEIMDTSQATYDGSDIDGFVSWVSGCNMGVQNSSNDGIYMTAFAIYDRALSDVEIEEMRAFFKTLEVA